MNLAFKLDKKDNNHDAYIMYKFLSYYDKYKIFANYGFSTLYNPYFAAFRWATIYAI